VRSAVRNLQVEGCGAVFLFNNFEDNLFALPGFILGFSKGRKLLGSTESIEVAVSSKSLRRIL
jgi:hypothetical protein